MHSGVANVMNGFDSRHSRGLSYGSGTFLLPGLASQIGQALTRASLANFAQRASLCLFGAYGKLGDWRKDNWEMRLAALPTATTSGKASFLYVYF